MIDEPQEIWAWCLLNWHKILVVILAVAGIWKYFFSYIRPAVHKDTSQPLQHNVLIQLPKEGCVITVKPLKRDYSPEDS